MTIITQISTQQYGLCQKEMVNDKQTQLQCNDVLRVTMQQATFNKEHIKQPHRELMDVLDSKFRIQTYRSLVTNC